MDLNSKLVRMKSEDISVVRDSVQTEPSLSLSLISSPEMIERFSQHNQQLFTSSFHSAFHPPRFSAFSLVRAMPAPGSSSEGPGGLPRPEQSETSETNKRKSSVKSSGSCKKTREKIGGKQTTAEETVGVELFFIVKIFYYSALHTN